MMVIAMLVAAAAVGGDKNYAWVAVVAGLGAFFGFIVFMVWKEK
jgi:hypothetical protein